MNPNSSQEVREVEQVTFDTLMERLRKGDAEAARYVFDLFVQRLVALANKKLDRRLRAKEDPEDAVQSAFRSFFDRYGNGQFVIQDWKSLWSMLALITRRKCSRLLKHYGAGRRDVNREVAPVVAADESTADWDPSDSEPTPEEAASLEETIQLLLASLEDAKHRQIVLLTLQGLSAEEVGKNVHCTERTVHRVLGKVRDWLVEHSRE